MPRAYRGVSVMLPVRDHIARRTVEQAFRERKACAEAWNVMCRELDAAISPVFCKGRKLAEGDVARLGDLVSERLASLDPVVLVDHSREATRTKPKGEAREILCLSPYADQDEGKRFIELSAVRVVLTRKKAVIESSSSGVRFTEHAMRRAVLREVVGAERVENRFAGQMLDHMGTVVLARALMGRGIMAAGDTLPLPFEEGLILGGFAKAPDTVFERLVYDNTGRYKAGFPINTLLTESQDGAAASNADVPIYKAQTVIGDDETTLSQMELLVAFRAFSARHRDVLNALGEAALWNETLLRPVRRLADVRPAYEAALSDLARLMTDPDLNAIRGGRPVEEPEPLPGLPPAYVIADTREAVAA